MKSFIKRAKTWVNDKYLASLAVKAPAYPKLENEAERLEALAALKIVGTAQEERFDRITNLAAQVFEVPICQINFVAKDKQFTKSCYGADIEEIPREMSFCTHALVSTDLYEIPDMLQDPLFAKHPLVTGFAHIRFYAGQPVVTADGHRVGTLCLLDKKSRSLSIDERKLLADLSKWVELEMNVKNLSLALETRKQMQAELEKMQNQIKDYAQRLELAVKEGENELFEQEERYRALFDNSPFASVVFQDDVLILIDKSAEELFGSDILGKKMNESLMRLAGDENAKRIMDSVFAIKDFNGHDLQMLNCVMRPESIFDAELRIFGLMINGRQAYQILIRDVTEELAAKRKEAEVLDLKNRFITIVSHQLRTPLSAIRWNLEMLMEEERQQKLDAETNDLVNESYKANTMVVERIGALIMALDIEQGNAYLELEEVALGKLFQAILEQWSERFTEKGVALTWTPEEVMALSLFTIDQKKIEFVLDELLANAHRYTSEGEVKVFVKFIADGAQVEIMDSGIGVSADALEHIFDRFYRSDEAMTVFTDASGLGLYICKNYLEIHGGNLICEPLEKGSRFTAFISRERPRDLEETSDSKR